jgi:hypothetical protein
VKKHKLCEASITKYFNTGISLSDISIDLSIDSNSSEIKDNSINSSLNFDNEVITFHMKADEVMKILSELQQLAKVIQSHLPSHCGRYILND